MEELDVQRVLSLLSDPESQYTKGNGKTTAMLYVLLRTINKYKNTAVLIPSENYPHALRERDCALQLAKLLKLEVVNDAIRENKIVLNLDG